MGRPLHGGDALEVALEIGAKRTFAVALAWPGWSRSGRDETSAVEALFTYAPRYASVLRYTRLGFRAPSAGTRVRVVERLSGGAGTDFGAPEVAPSVDAEPMTDADLRRAASILRACWRAFDASVLAAGDRTLRTGPRGGGRSVEKIVGHVLDADGAYLSRIGVKLRPAEGEGPLGHARRVALEGLASAVRDGVPPSPRGGARWTPRYFVRRVAWHVLDHTWEIEDRTPS